MIREFFQFILYLDLNQVLINIFVGHDIDARVTLVTTPLSSPRRRYSQGPAFLLKFVFKIPELLRERARVDVDINNLWRLVL
jgi:hypothetical protein